MHIMHIYTTKIYITQSLPRSTAHGPSIARLLNAARSILVHLGFVNAHQFISYSCKAALDLFLYCLYIVSSVYSSSLVYLLSLLNFFVIIGSLLCLMHGCEALESQSTLDV